MSWLAPNGGQQVADGGSVDLGRSVLDDLATRLEARAATIAGDVVHLVVGSPASGPAHATAELVADTEGFVGAVAQSLRSGRRRSDPALVERWRASVDAERLKTWHCPG